MDFLPEEIVELIFFFLTLETAKSLSLASKRYFRISMNRIWKEPRFSNMLPSDIPFCKPIQVLHSEDFEFFDPLIFCTIPTLKTLYIHEMSFSVEDLALLLPYNLIINANILYDEDDEIDFELLEALKLHKNIKLDFKLCLMCPFWTIENLFLFQDFNIGLFDLCSVSPFASTQQLVDFLIKTKPENVVLNGGALRNITHQNIRDLVKNNVAVTFIDTECLDNDDLIEKPFPWDILTENRFLKQIRFEFSDIICLQQLGQFMIDGVQAQVEVQDLNEHYTDIFEVFAALENLHVTSGIIEDSSVYVLESLIIEFRH